MSRRQELTVTFLLPENVPSKITVTKIRSGKVAKLPCNVASRNSQLHISWWQNGRKIQISKKKKINKKGILLLKQVAKSDEGLYSCYDENRKILNQVLLQIIGKFKNFS